MQFLLSSRQGVHGIFQYVLPYPNHELLDVLVPWDLSHVGEEQRSVSGAHAGAQGFLVFTPEIPLMKWKKLSSFGCFSELFAYSHHSVNSHTFYFTKPDENFFRELFESNLYSLYFYTNIISTFSVVVY